MLNLKNHGNYARKLIVPVQISDLRIMCVVLKPYLYNFAHLYKALVQDFFVHVIFVFKA